MTGEPWQEPGFVVWLTGLSGAGKTTIAGCLAGELRARGRRVQVLDGDEVRRHLGRDLGFSRRDRDENVARIAYVARLLLEQGVVVIVAAISPYREARAQARRRLGRFVEVYVRCPLAECARRDVKGLYRKALRGEIPAFTGVSDPYEEPDSPEIVVDTGTQGPDESAARILATLEGLGHLSRPAAIGGNA